MRRREHWRHGLALRGVAGLIHGDETLAAQIRRDVANGDAAERSRRREHRMVGLDVHDVVVFGHRPIRPEHAVLAVMHRVFPAQPVEIRPERVGLEQLRMADVEITEWNRLSPVARGAQMGISGEIDGSVHEHLPDCSPPKHAGGAMFYLITSRAVRRRKDELGAFGRIEAGSGLGLARRIRPVTSAWPKTKSV